MYFVKNVLKQDMILVKENVQLVENLLEIMISNKFGYKLLLIK